MKIKCEIPTCYDYINLNYYSCKLINCQPYHALCLNHNFCDVENDPDIKSISIKEYKLLQILK